MDLEKEPQKPTPPKVTPIEPAKPYQTQPTTTFIPFKKSYVQEVCVVMGIGFLITGLVGFVVDNFLGAHLSYTHNVIHVASGIFALWFGFDSLQNAKRFSYIFGVLYGLLGLAGFFLGRPGMPSVGSISEDRTLWKVIPNVLELGTVDHSLHILFAAIFLVGATVTFKRYQRI